MFVLMPFARNGVQTTYIVEPSKHFGIPSYGVYRPLGGLESVFVNKGPSLYSSYTEYMYSSGPWVIPRCASACRRRLSLLIHELGRRPLRVRLGGAPHSRRGVHQLGGALHSRWSFRRGHGRSSSGAFVHFARRSAARRASCTDEEFLYSHTCSETRTYDLYDEAHACWFRLPHKFQSTTEGCTLATVHVAV